jgi:hypothetical protein
LAGLETHHFPTDAKAEETSQDGEFLHPRWCSDRSLAPEEVYSLGLDFVYRGSVCSLCDGDKVS